MPWISWLLAGIYVAGLVAVAQIYVRTCKDSPGRPVRIDATLIGVLWPGLLLVFTIVGLCMLPTLGAKTPAERAALARAETEAAEARRQRLAASRKRSAELEAELAELDAARRHK